MLEKLNKIIDNFIKENSKPGTLVAAIILCCLVPQMREIVFNVVNGKYTQNAQYLVNIVAVVMTTFEVYFWALIALMAILPKRSWRQDEAMIKEFNRCLNQFCKTPIVLVQIITFACLLKEHQLFTSLGTFLGYGLMFGMMTTVVLLAILLIADKEPQ